MLLVSQCTRQQFIRSHLSQSCPQINPHVISGVYRYMLTFNFPISFNTSTTSWRCQRFDSVFQKRVRPDVSLKDHTAGVIHIIVFWSFTSSRFRVDAVMSKDYAAHSSGLRVQVKGRFTHSMPFPCRGLAVPLPCRAAKGLENVFPI